MRENNTGWICPKCGAANNPENDLCHKCSCDIKIEIEPFTPPHDPFKIDKWVKKDQEIDPFDPYKDIQRLYQYRCGVCGMEMSGAMGYVCPRFNCPGRVTCTIGTSTFLTERNDDPQPE